MNLAGIYRNSSVAMILIGAVALVALWLGGWAIAVFMQCTFGFCSDALRCSIPVGHNGLPFWPIASLLVVVLHGFFMFRYSILGAQLGVPNTGRWNWRAGAYDAQLDNPFSRVIAKDFIVIGLLLIAFLVLCTCQQWYGWCWGGC